MDLSLFSNYTFTMAVVIGSIISIGMFGVIFLFPLFLQNVLGQTAMQTGIIMFPAALASGLMMPISGQIFDRYGPRVIVAGGLLIVAYTTWMMAMFNEFTPFAWMTFWLAMRGLGMGFCFMPVTTAGMNTVPQHLVGRASALNNVIRQVSSAFGITMFTTVMQNRQAVHFASLAAGTGTSGEEWARVQQMMVSLAGSSGFDPGMLQGLGLSVMARQLVKQSMVSAINDCFVISALLCLFAFFLALTLKNRKTAEAGEKAAFRTAAD